MLFFVAQGTRRGGFVSSQLDSGEPHSGKRGFFRAFWVVLPRPCRSPRCPYRARQWRGERALPRCIDPDLSRQGVKSSEGDGPPPEGLPAVPVRRPRLRLRFPRLRSGQAGQAWRAGRVWGGRSCFVIRRLGLAWGKQG